MAIKTQSEAEDSSLPQAWKVVGSWSLDLGPPASGRMDGGCESVLKRKEASTEDTFSFMGDETQGGEMKLQRGEEALWGNG